MRERLSDFDFFKARVEELQKENSNLYDARAALETEIAANRIRLAGMNDQVSHQKYFLKYLILRILDSPNPPIQRIRRFNEFTDFPNLSIFRNYRLSEIIDFQNYQFLE